MKAGIVTFHFVNNFGGVLQSYALWRTVEMKLNCATVVIDYRNWFISLTDTIRLFPITTDLEEMKAGWRTMGLRLARMWRFQKFIRSRCRLTKRYRTGFSVCLHPPQCDAFICGSDQIWNPYITFGLAGTYFLNFVSKDTRKFSYAASFGIDHMCFFQAAKLRRYLKGFTDISVREKQGKQIVKSSAGREAVQMIDPVFLLEDSEWEEIAKKPLSIEGSYILLYVMQQSEAVYRSAEKLKEKWNMPVIEISRYGRQPDFVDVCLIDVGPEEFVWLFQNAECICTNSYHGLAFSIIFEKNLCLIPCKRFRLRITGLLELLHIEMLRESEGALLSYDKKRVKAILAYERQKAMRYLEKNLGEDDV